MFRQMQCFIAVVKNHSYTQAAIDCHLSQSSLSQRIKELQASLGVTLIKRKGRSFELTAAGDYFYQHSQAILEQVDQLTTETQAIDTDTAGAYTLKLGYLRKFGSQEFLQAVAEFSRQFPQVKVQIHSDSYAELFTQVREGHIDLNFSDQRYELSPAFENEFLTAADYMVVVAPTAFPTHQSVIDTTALKDLPCLLIVGTDEYASEQSYYRDVLGIQSPFQIAASFGAAQMLAATGQGYIVVNSLTAQQINPKTNRVIKLVDHGRDLTQHYYAYWKKDNSGYYIETFAQILKDQFK
ncbi:LysR family transcriptional regulator [Levilactobacillus tangyuanensis]|uniref:LysR family transcriptional regulator n=1 Tax=Levilactobacillus tangyuanensis TaxID=2486021 RepID=A0ABW1TNN1_9LACO|nr:LysR family transcriptional regulator [Levilactobacillus tangyuanensis]